MTANKAVQFVFTMLLAGCAATQPWALKPQPAAGVPDRFVVNGGGGVMGANTPATGCAARLIDPRDNTRLVLIRSTHRSGPVEYIGDYDVSPAGKYRVAANELLRVDCGTGRALGKVARRG